MSPVPDEQPCTQCGGDGYHDNRDLCLHCNGWGDEPPPKERPRAAAEHGYDIGKAEGKRAGRLEALRELRNEVLQDQAYGVIGIGACDRVCEHIDARIAEIERGTE